MSARFRTLLRMLPHLYRCQHHQAHSAMWGVVYGASDSPITTGPGSFMNQTTYLSLVEFAGLNHGFGQVTTVRLWLYARNKHLPLQGVGVCKGFPLFLHRNKGVTVADEALLMCAVEFSRSSTLSYFAVFRISLLFLHGHTGPAQKNCSAGMSKDGLPFPPETRETLPMGSYMTTIFPPRPRTV